MYFLTMLAVTVLAILGYYQKIIGGIWIPNFPAITHQSSAEIEHLIDAGAPDFLDAFAPDNDILIESSVNTQETLPNVMKNGIPKTLCILIAIFFGMACILYTLYSTWKKYVNLTKEVCKLRDIVQNKNVEIEKLSNNLSRDEDDRKIQNQNKCALVQQLQHEKQYAEKLVAHLNHKLSTSECLLQAKERALQNMMSECCEEQQKYQDCIQKISAFQGLLKERDTCVHELEHRNTESEKTVAHLNALLHKLQAELSHKNTHAEKQESSLHVLQEHIQSLQEELKNHEEKAAMMVRNKVGLERQLTEVKHLANKLQHELLKKNLAGTEKSSNVLKEQIETLQLELIRRNEKIAMMANSQRFHMDKNTSLQKEMGQLKDLLSAKESLIQNLQRDIADFKNDEQKNSQKESFHQKDQGIFNRGNNQKQLLDQAKNEIQNKNYEKAVYYLTQALKLGLILKNVTADLLYYRALAYSRLDQFEKAAKDCEFIIKTVDCTNVAAHTLSAYCNLSLERHEEYLSNIQELARLKRNGTERLVSRANRVSSIGMEVQEYELDLDVMGLSRGATWAEVKQAYRKLSLAHHPDKHANATQEQRHQHQEKFKIIKASAERTSPEAAANNYANNLKCFTDMKSALINTLATQISDIQ